MEHLAIDQLIRIIESIVFTGPITKEELKANLKYTINHNPDNDTLDSIISSLKEKYSIHFYGIEFLELQGQIQFKSRNIKEIVNR